MDQKNQWTAIVVIESSRWLMASAVDIDTATTLIALVSDDPASWDEAMSVWPRYRTPAVCEFVSSVPLEECDRDEAMKVLLSAKSADLQSRIDEAMRRSAFQDNDLA